MGGGLLLPEIKRAPVFGGGTGGQRGGRWGAAAINFADNGDALHQHLTADGSDAVSPTDPLFDLMRTLNVAHSAAPRAIGGDLRRLTESPLGRQSQH